MRATRGRCCCLLYTSVDRPILYATDFSRGAFGAAFLDFLAALFGAFHGGSKIGLSIGVAGGLTGSESVMPFKAAVGQFIKLGF